MCGVASSGENINFEGSGCGSVGRSGTFNSRKIITV